MSNRISLCLKTTRQLAFWKITHCVFNAIKNDVDQFAHIQNRVPDYISPLIEQGKSVVQKKHARRGYKLFTVYNEEH